MNRLFLALLFFIVTITVSSFDLTAREGRCPRRGPPGPAGPAGTDGVTGPTGPTGAACSLPDDPPGTLTFTFHPFTNATGDGSWNAFILAPDQTFVGETGPISLSAPPPSVSVEVIGDILLGPYTITFQLLNTQTSPQILTQNDTAVSVTNSFVNGTTYIFPQGGQNNPNGIPVMTAGDSFQLFYTPYTDIY